MGTEGTIINVKGIMTSIREEIKEKYPSQIDVEEIMAEIRSDIRAKGYVDDTVPFSDIPLNMMTIPQGNTEENINLLGARGNVAAYRELRSNRRIGPIIIFVKKVIRKLTKFYIEPIVVDQNENNRLMTACISDLHGRIGALELSLSRLQEENNELRKALEGYKK